MTELNVGAGGQKNREESGVCNFWCQENLTYWKKGLNEILTSRTPTVDNNKTVTS